MSLSRYESSSYTEPVLSSLLLNTFSCRGFSLGLIAFDQVSFKRRASIARMFNRFKSDQTSTPNYFALNYQLQ